ncbi:hypothetical protein BC827DRAFT_1312692 [Russula dissimulans]|nr:hypothetical protein BC827DRAFT_1312692 [Russula dissimulans]
MQIVRHAALYCGVARFSVSLTRFRFSRAHRFTLNTIHRLVLETPQDGDGDRSAGSLGLMRMHGDDSTTSWRVDDDDNNPSLKGVEIFPKPFSRDGASFDKHPSSPRRSPIGTAVASLNDDIYCGQYSADFRLHVYDMTAPPSSPTPQLQQTQRPSRSRQTASDEPTTMKIIKVIQSVLGGWTITDAHMSPDIESYCWADSASGNVLISGSDDTFMKVWRTASLAYFVDGVS